MSEYLDALIRRLEAEAQEQRDYARQLRETKKASQRSTEQLNRTLQRLEILRELHAREKGRRAVPRTHKRTAAAAQRARSSAKGVAHHSARAPAHR
jgi:hypothetical protein